VSTLGDFCGSPLGDFMRSALWDRGCGPEACYGCTFLPHTFSVKLSGISGSLVYYEYDKPSDMIEPFDLSVCNRIYSVSLPAWREPRCESSGLTPYIGRLLWSSTFSLYVDYQLLFTHVATLAGNQITAILYIVVNYFWSHSIEWSITIPWTEDDCCHGIGRSLAMTTASPIGPCDGPWSCFALSPGTGDGSICTIMS